MRAKNLRYEKPLEYFLCLAATDNQYNHYNHYNQYNQYNHCNQYNH